MGKIKNFKITFLILIVLAGIIIPVNIFASNEIVGMSVSVTQKGDLNGNNKIDIGDIQLLLRHMSASKSESVAAKHPEWKLSSEKEALGDINKNGRIDIGDIQILLRYMSATKSSDVAKKHPEWIKAYEEKEDSKKEEQKQEESKSEETKSDEKEETKQEETKQEESSKDSKSEETKQEESKGETKTETETKQETTQNTTKQEENKGVKVTGVKLNKTSLSLKVGSTASLIATVNPTNATNKKVYWETSDATVVQVSSSGKITAANAGTATILVASSEDTSKTAKCTVTVIPKVESIAVENLSVNVGSTKNPAVTIKPANAEKTVTYEVADTESSKYVTIKDGKITGKKKGTAKIKAKSADGKETTFEVTVKIPATGVKKDASSDFKSFTLYTGQTKTLKAVVEPADATNTNVYWETSDATIAKVTQNGKVTALKTGIVTITARNASKNGKYTEIWILTVKAPKVSAKKANVELIVNQSKTLTVLTNPSNATYSVKKWHSTNRNVVTITQTGKITGVAGTKAGRKAIVYLETTDGQKVEWTITVKTSSSSSNSSSNSNSSSGGSSQNSNSSTTGNTTVTPNSSTSNISVTSVALNKTSLSLTVGNTETLTATIKPTNATNKKVTWKSSNEQVAKVTQNGKITAVKAGTATITVTSSADSNKTAKCNVTVKTQTKTVEAKTWTEDYKVSTKYNTTIFKISYKTDTSGKTTYTSVERLSNIMKVPYYNQTPGSGGRYKGTGSLLDRASYDHNFVQHSYNNGRGDSGWACGPFSYAMIASYLNNKTIAPYTYGETGGWVKNMSSFNCVSRGVSRNAESLKKTLLFNRPVILGINEKVNCPFTDGSHFLVITGVTKDGKFTVNNPSDYFNGDKYFGGKTKCTSYISESNPKRTSWTWSQISDLGSIFYIHAYSSDISTKALETSREAAKKHATEVVAQKNKNI